mgnify:FL=1
MRNVDWGVELRKAHSKVVKKRPLRFPSGIDLDGDHRCVRMKLSGNALVSNMQTNAAAFEAWALALHVWCRVECVVLDWEPIREKAGYRHYQRFLYRVEKFRSWFPWLEVANADALGEAEAITGSELILNVSKSVGKAEAAKPEARLERQLRSSDGFRARYELEKVGTQFPVGLFGTQVAEGRQIFPSGSSAIDILARDGKDRLWLFELKAGENIPAGIISELLFYTWVMQDAMIGRFRFEDKPPGDEGGIQPADVLACKTIEARFIGHEFHPLLDGGGILNELNNAAVGTSPVAHFGLIRIACSVVEPFRFLITNEPQPT